ncbi:type II toxin-antitoxin system RelE/ParE family toxin [Petrimonas sp.]|uniref:type II toxin-antitoxin system RelE/ParE family toxin n=1 Tax=Petrimonas sp. TaxID=2023866 RepID=UPI003F50E5BB
MKREVVTFGGYFEAFVETLTAKELFKLDYILSLLETQDRMPSKFIKYIREELYELRMEFEGNIFRIFFIFDGNNIVVLFNGFQKKSQKTPRKEINQALKLKKEYYAQKRL